MNKKLAFFLNWVLAIALVLSYLAAFVPPDKFEWLTLFGLGYKYLLLLNLCFIGYWLLLWKSKIWLSICIVLVGTSFMLRVVNLRPLKATPTNANSTFSLLSYNVRGFDIYTLSEDSSTVDKMFDFISQQKQDIYCFQEFSHSRYAKYGNRFFEKNGYHKSNTKGKVVTFSKFPILETEEIELGKGVGKAIYTDLIIQADTVRIYNIHLQSNMLSKEEVLQLKEYNVKKIRFFLKGLIQKLHLAAQLRSRQVKELKKHIKSTFSPILICGDLNDSPNSFAYQRLSQSFSDAASCSIGEFNFTYSNGLIKFRIDYIFHEKGKVECIDFQTFSILFSDHSPVRGSFLITHTETED